MAWGAVAHAVPLCLGSRQAPGLPAPGPSALQVQRPGTAGSLNSFSQDSWHLGLEQNHHGRPSLPGRPPAQLPDGQSDLCSVSTDPPPPLCSSLHCVGPPHATGVPRGAEACPAAESLALNCVQMASDDPPPPAPGPQAAPSRRESRAAHGSAPAGSSPWGLGLGLPRSLTEDLMSNFVVKVRAVRVGLHLPLEEGPGRYPTGPAGPAGKSGKTRGGDD